MAGQTDRGFWGGHHNAPAPTHPTGQAPPSQYPQTGHAPPSQYPQSGHAPQHPTQEPIPQGPLYVLYSEANKNYRLTSREDGVVLAYKNQQDPTQYWIKLDHGDKFVDQEGKRAFILISRSTGKALSHGTENCDAVTQEPFHANNIDNSILWSQGDDLGKGWTAIRAVTNIHLNLDVDHGDKKHGGVKEGNRLVTCTWNKQDNQKWTLAPVGPED